MSIGFDSFLKIFGFFSEIFMRIDKFLKVSRILKRRSLAKDACDAGKIIVNGKEAKPSKEIKPLDEVELHYATGSVKFRILQVKETVKKDEAQSLYEVIP